MKKIFLLLCLLCMAGQATAQTLIDGIYYYLDSGSGTAQVTRGSSKYSGSISIPENVTDGATYSVTSIGYQAFRDCTSLTSITIPNSVTYIGHCAFQDCWGLTSITIPNSVTSLGEDCFWGCSGLTNIVVDAENTHYDSRNNCNAIIETSSNDLIACCMNTIIPNSVRSLRGNCFRGCTGLTSINIPNSVTSLGESCFCDCTGLTSITIPNSVTNIGGGAFYGCSGLTNLVVDAENTHYDSRNNCNAIIET